MLEEHESTKRILEDMPGVSVSAGLEDDCAMYLGEERGIISIYYATIDQKSKIMDILGNTFFGVPYHLFNT